MDFDWYRDLTDLPKGPRMNVSGVFGPRGELIDELQRRGVSYRVYGEQMTMEPDGDIAPGLAAHAARDYPGTHIDFGVSPLNTYDAAAQPIADAFALQPDVDAYAALPETVPIVLNPGPPAAATSFDIDGPDSEAIPDQEWASIKGARSLAQHDAYLANATRVLSWMP
jgi:hypothetical protein